MLPERLHWVIEAFEPEGDPWVLLQIARDLEAEGNLEGAAAVYDRAYGLDPAAEKIRQARATVLDRLAVREHGLVFRYVPGGPFLMGSRDGEPDEQPLHPVWLAPYWMAEVPISWADYCRLMDWEEPPEAWPRQELERREAFVLHEENKIRYHYCVDPPPGQESRRWRRRRPPPGADDLHYETRPMVAVGWQAAEDLARKLSTGKVCYYLPTEAQWEKAARGGLIGARHAWGDEPPLTDNCDFNRFHDFEIRPSKTFPPNGYGLYAMNGGVWEWTADWYDRDYYRHAAAHDPKGPEKGEEKVLRGGSWADCADVVTVSFRMSRDSSHWRADRFGAQFAPNLGFRLCRVVPGQRWP
jgi:formylglycine-generating enzyme required for sulfatase activity